MKAQCCIAPVTLRLPAWFFALRDLEQGEKAIITHIDEVMAHLLVDRIENRRRFPPLRPHRRTACISHRLTAWLASLTSSLQRVVTLGPTRWFRYLRPSAPAD